MNLIPVVHIYWTLISKVTGGEPESSFLDGAEKVLWVGGATLLLGNGSWNIKKLK